MIVWLDAQLPPAAARWMTERLGVDAVAVRDVGLRDATDRAIFEAAREAGAVVMSKDSDFVDLVGKCGPPPQVLWLTMGNCTNARLQEVLGRHWAGIERLLLKGEALIEVGARAGSKG